MCSVFLCFFPSSNCSPSIPQNEHQSRGSGKCGKSEREERKKKEERKRKVGKLSLAFRLSPPVHMFPPTAYYLANEFGYVFSFVLATSGNVSPKWIAIDIYNISNSLYLVYSQYAEVPKLWSTSAIHLSSILQEQI